MNVFGRLLPLALIVLTSTPVFAWSTCPERFG